MPSDALSIPPADPRPAPADQVHASHSVALFALGFRPFFLLAAVYAVGPMVVWLLEYGFGVSLTTRWGGMFFHGHEMVFGFTSAAIAGFLLTAVPNWTGSAPLRGVALMGLVLLWVLGRIAMFASSFVPPMIVATLDLAFYPGLIIALTPSLVRAGQRRNFFVPIVLSAFVAANVCTHVGTPSDSDLTRFGLHLGAYLAVLLILIIGNRVVPAFTVNALKRNGLEAGLRSNGWMLPSVMMLAAGALTSDLVAAPSWWVGTLSAAAGITIAWRLSGWRGVQGRRWPLVWVLHVGYGFVALGFLSLAAARWFDALPWSAAFHVFTSGAIGTMVLGMMSRVSLGHTGRPLEAPRLVVVGYVLVIVGALIRSFAPIAGPPFTQTGVVWGGTLWLLGYFLFLLVYAPMLLAPRVDGRPG